MRHHKPYAAITAGIIIAIATAGCAHAPSLRRLVGGNRDDHGCLSAAGYTWSNARHDCVRVWEVGLRFDDGPSALFLVYSTDSAYAEIFTPEKAPVLCRRVKGTDTWEAPKGPERVSISNDVITVHTSYYDYTRTRRP